MDDAFLLPEIEISLDWPAKLGIFWNIKVNPIGELGCAHCNKLVLVSLGTPEEIILCSRVLVQCRVYVAQNYAFAFQFLKIRFNFNIHFAIFVLEIFNLQIPDMGVPPVLVFFLWHWQRPVNPQCILFFAGSKATVDLQKLLYSFFCN